MSLFCRKSKSQKMSIFGKLFFAKMDDDEHHHPLLHLQLSAFLTLFDFLTFKKRYI